MVFTVIGLGHGDEGKGSVVDWLARHFQAQTVVRFNGGPQAAHYVVTPGGVIHCFAQWGSGTLAGCQTHLSRFMLIDPLAMGAEAEVLASKGVAKPFERLTVSRRSLVVTPFHRIVNRMREAARGGAHYGSCGMGVGEAVMDARWMGQHALVVGDLLDEATLRQRLRRLQLLKVDLAEQLVDQHPGNVYLAKQLARLRRPEYVAHLAEYYLGFARKSGVCLVGDGYLTRLFSDGPVVFEGAQGVLLDVEYGPWPYVTKTRTTFANADQLLVGADYTGPVTRIGVLRAYATRHGPGPFVTEDCSLARQLPELHNRNGRWQGPMRIGWFDLVAARYALDIAGDQIDGLAITNLDRLCGLGPIKVCIGYRLAEVETEDPDRFFEWDSDPLGGVVIRKIRVPDRPERDHQIKLAELLARCEPVYLELAGWDDPLGSSAMSYLHFLEERLRVPITLISFGPSASDKYELNNGVLSAKHPFFLGCVCTMRLRI